MTVSLLAPWLVIALARITRPNDGEVVLKRDAVEAAFLFYVKTLGWISGSGLSLQVSPTVASGRQQ